MTEITRCSPDRDKPLIYVAGPMFSQAELGWQTRIGDTLEAAGFETYVPQHNGIEVAAVMKRIGLPLFQNPLDIIEVTEVARKLVFALDTFQLLHVCDAIVFNLDGRVPDDGSVMEAALLWTANKPVVMYKTTSVTMLGGFDNPMVSGLGMRWEPVCELDKLAAQVKEAIAADAADGYTFTPGPHVSAVMALGAEVCGRLPAIKALVGLDPKLIPAEVRKLRNELHDLLVAAGLWDEKWNDAYAASLTPGG